MSRRFISAEVPDGELAGWVQGTGPPVLLLHGGPGLSFGYLDALAVELGPEFELASYQQRGLPPSSAEGPFSVWREVHDALAFLDALGWEQAFVVGHSWGGHLLLHLALAAGPRVLGALAVDPLGGVGDGGMAAFETEMGGRIPERSRSRAQELDERAMRGEGTEEDSIESLRLYWPAYFASPAHAPPMPEMRISVEAYAGIVDSLRRELPHLSGALPTVTVPFGFVAGVKSPMPVDEAAAPTAAVIPGAWLVRVEQAGHFPWYEQPGCTRAALDRLVNQTKEAGPSGLWARGRR
jgi:pimeloyl-ACP methyl ester carboxylesterase